MPRSQAAARRHAHHFSDATLKCSEPVWPDETFVVLPETPRVRLSPRRKLNAQTPGWPNDVGETIRMYQDDEEDETVNFTMNADFIESIFTERVFDIDMRAFIPPLSPTKARMLSPSKRNDEFPADMQDHAIEIPDSAGLSDATRDAIATVWMDDDQYEEDGFEDGVHYLRVVPL